MDWGWGGEQRERVFLRQRILSAMQGHICAICGRPMLKGCTVDHVIPKARGGADRIGNIVAAHLACNREKAARMPTGCELIFLLAVNARLGVKPDRW